MPSRNRKKRSKQRAEYLQKQDDILSQENKAKARARYKADPENKKASVRDSYKADPEKKKASVRDSYNADIESKQSAKRQRYQEDLEENRAAKRQRYQENVEENRAVKRQKYEDNSATSKASERNRYWNDPAVRLAKRAAERKRYRRGHYHPKVCHGMLYCTSIKKSYRKMCMHATYVQHACKGSAIHFTCKACMVTQLLCTVLYDLSIEYWGVILNLMYKKASLLMSTFDTMATRLQLCRNLIAFARVEH